MPVYQSYWPTSWLYCFSWRRAPTVTLVFLRKKLKFVGGSMGWGDRFIFCLKQVSLCCPETRCVDHVSWVLILTVCTSTVSRSLHLIVSNRRHEEWKQPEEEWELWLHPSRLPLAQRSSVKKIKAQPDRLYTWILKGLWYLGRPRSTQY